MAISYKLWGIRFTGMDDYAMMAFLSGEYTGVCEPFLYYPNVLFTAPIAFLYKIMPVLPWYTIAFIAYMYFGIVAVYKSILKPFKTVASVIFATVVFGVLYAGLFVYPVVYMQFTSTGAIAMTGAIALVLMMKSEDEKKERIIDAVLLALTLYPGICIRMDIGYLGMSVLASTFVLKILLRDLKIKRMITAGAFCIALFLGAFLTQRIYLNTVDGWSFFREYNNARVGLLDHPTIGYEYAPEVFDSIGWNKEESDLAQIDWFAMDDSISVKNINAVVTASNDYFDTHKEYKKAFFINVIKTGYTLKYMLYWMILAIVILVLVLLPKKRVYYNGFYLLGVVAYPIGAALTFAALAWFGRMTFAAMNSVFMIAMVPGVLMIIQLMKYFDIRKQIPVLIVSAVVALMLCLNGLSLIHSIPGYKRMYALKDELEAYTTQHMDNLYIYDNSLSFMGNCLDTPDYRDKYNFIFWGGTFYNSPQYIRQLQRCGYDRVTSSDFFNDDIYFISAQQPHQALTAFMESKYPDCSIEIVDEFDNFIVYRFTR